MCVYVSMWYIGFPVGRAFDNALGTANMRYRLKDLTLKPAYNLKPKTLCLLFNFVQATFNASAGYIACSYNHIVYNICLTL